jgi:hypothetical protein
MATKRKKKTYTREEIATQIAAIITTHGFECDARILDSSLSWEDLGPDIDELDKHEILDAVDIFFQVQLIDWSGGVLGSDSQLMQQPLGDLVDLVYLSLGPPAEVPS